MKYVLYALYRQRIVRRAILRLMRSYLNASGGGTLDGVVWPRTKYIAYMTDDQYHWYNVFARDTTYEERYALLTLLRDRQDKRERELYDEDYDGEE